MVCATNIYVDACVLKMIYDPALGKTREQRAFGKEAKGANGVSTGSARSKAFIGNRKVEKGMWSGPRASYGRYQVGDTASDAVNKGVR